MKIRKLDKDEREHVKQRMIHNVVNEGNVLVYSLDLGVFAKYLKTALDVDPDSYNKPYIFLPVPDRVDYFKQYWIECPDFDGLKEISPEIVWGMEVIEDDAGLGVRLKYFLNSLAYSVSLVADDILAFIDQHGVNRCKSWYSNTLNLFMPPRDGIHEPEDGNEREEHQR